MGTGRLLMAECERHAAGEMEIKRFLLHSQKDKRGFYEALGYEVEVGKDGETEVFDEEGIEHVRMWKVAR
jgi:predicted GNAT family N-acyltransferase